MAESALIRQHLIDPALCIRCNTCEATCPQGAVMHDGRNYAVDSARCHDCAECLATCPTGAIDNWRQVPRARAYSVVEQLLWEALPAELRPERPAEASAPGEAHGRTARKRARPPWSAAHAYTHLYGPRASAKYIVAKAAGNLRITERTSGYDAHHIVLDFGAMPFPVLEGQSIGVLAPGGDDRGHAHHPRLYSIASPRNGERVGGNTVSLIVKRVLEDRQGRPVRGVASNYLCDLRRGDEVQVIGPFGASFLMPNHPKSHIVMIGTGTGSAPMRAMIERRRLLRGSGRFEGGRLMLFLGARTRQELPWAGALEDLPSDFIDIHLAFSRASGQPKRRVTDALREHAADVARLLADPDACFYVCGLEAMAPGVLQALGDIAAGAGLDWPALAGALEREGRLHFETY